MRSNSRSIFVLAIAFAVGIGPAAFAQSSGAGSGTAAGAPQVTQPPQDGDVNWKGVGVGAGTVVGNVLYIPAKLVYGILGGIAGGAGYALTGGNQQVSNTIWRSSLGGDYVLTPDMVRGKDPIHFSGPTQTAAGAPSAGADPNGSGLALAAGSASSASPPSPQNSSAVPPVSANAGPRPIDNGAGPVGAPAPVHKTAPAPDNGIE